MITAEKIEQALLLTGVVLNVENGVPFVTANEPVTEEMQQRVREWYVAGDVPDFDAEATSDQIADYRWRAETGGVAVEVSSGTHRFDTRRELEARWLGLEFAASQNPSMVQPWKTLDHGFVVLTAADILVVVAAVRAHIAACFAKEAELLVNPPTLRDLPSSGWPC